MPSSDSHHSNNSTCSTHSFASLILPTKWSGSLVRMLGGDKGQYRKDRCRR
ncbi:hypothetical protein Fmac_011373 [Flemingia macrophylla]|uniref:Uncharacterized protein n=1 Tax=Flemingia macrophylla TaxID=520843 RepID=A0ABD1MM96_9FABA